MSAVQVVVRPVSRPTPSKALAPLHGLFDVVIDGVNITARIGEAQAVGLLAELALAVAALVAGRRPRATVQLYADDEAWELGLERDGEHALVTVFRSGAHPEVAVHERRVALTALRRALETAIDEAPSALPLPRSARTSLEAARASLGAAPAADVRPVVRCARVIEPKAFRGVAFRATASFRQARDSGRRDAQVERADLHGLLVTGELSVTVRERTVRLGDVPLFLFAERLLVLAEDQLDSWQAARPCFRRFDVSGVRVGLRRGAGDSPVALSVASRELRDRGESVSFPKLHPATIVRAAVRFARRLARAFVGSEPEQESNLRLVALLDMARALSDRATDALRDDVVVNRSPDSYRTHPRRRQVGARGRWEHGGKMRFLPRWVATVPNIDLRSTFLCGDRLVVGATRELAALDRSTGAVLWRTATGPGATVVTPSALARLHSEGTITLLDLQTGESRVTARVVPRVAGGATGAVVHLPGLPKLLVVAEGDRRITAIDLVSGEVRWRHTARRASAFRMRRAGRLLLAAGGDATLVALDVATGEVVWRLRGRLPFAGDMTVDHDDVFVTSGVATATPALHRVDPWTGEIAFTAPLDDRPIPGRAPLVTSDVIVVPVRDARGVGATAFDRKSGEPLWTQEPGLASPTTAWLEVDDGIVANSDAGTLLCIDARTGALRYNHVFARNVDAEQPRRLEPVLRSGALFVPQHQVHVVRPRDGEILGTLPTDLIPDLVRVDERCDVYVAEESGHVAAFGAAPRLCVVRRDQPDVASPPSRKSTFPFIQ